MTENIKQNKYSVVVPVYNSERSLEELCGRIKKMFLELNGDYEIVLVDDSSLDNSWRVMKEIHGRNRNVKIIRLTKNFGQHNALMCGFHHVSGNYIITLDDDLQNPPEEIIKLIAEIDKKDYDAIFGTIARKQDTRVKRMGSALIYYMVNKIFNIPLSMKVSNVRIIKREIIDEIIGFKTAYPYISGMILSLTNNIGNIPVSHSQRRYGKSNYDIRGLVKLAFNLMINYSSIPLRFLTFIGFVVSVLSFCFGGGVIIKKILFGIPVPGWTTVIVFLSFINGLLLIILSIMGEYLMRIIK